LDEYFGVKVEHMRHEIFMQSQTLLIKQILYTLRFNDQTKPNEILVLSS